MVTIMGNSLTVHSGLVAEWWVSCGSNGLSETVIMWREAAVWLERDAHYDMFVLQKSRDSQEHWSASMKRKIARRASYFPHASNAQKGISHVIFHIVHTTVLQNMKVTWEIPGTGILLWLMFILPSFFSSHLWHQKMSGMYFPCWIHVL